jgi:pimeloyl-ACP methyl ester carboxylesterase
MRVALIGLALLLTACRQGSPQSALDRLHPCAITEGPPDAFCGQLRVFENRAAKDGRTIDLKIVVAPALRRDAKSDPLFVFEGGPGGGAATLAQYRVPMFRRFQTDRDIVLVDQRGIGASNPLDCTVESPDDEDFRTIEVYPVERYRSCLDKLHADPRLYTTSVAMDDMRTRSDQLAAPFSLRSPVPLVNRGLDRSVTEWTRSLARLKPSRSEQLKSDLARHAHDELDPMWWIIRSWRNGHDIGHASLASTRDRGRSGSVHTITPHELDRAAAAGRGVRRD